MERSSAEPPPAMPASPERLAGARPPPRETLDPRTRTLWRLTALLWSALVVIAAGGVVILLRRWDAPPWLLAVPLLVAVAWAVISVVVVPDVLYRHWRYELGGEEIDLQHGLWTVTRTLIPMARIQHVDTQRGPLQRRLGLASVMLYTAAGASTIPGLAAGTADALRDRIAALARTRDDL